jgi:uncharacterized damage-inducible protein DinB
MSLSATAFGDLEHELATTRRVFERLPDEQFGWKPHPKSMSLGQLAAHIATIPTWALYVLRETELDFSAVPVQPEHSTRDALLAAYDAKVAELRAAVAEHASDEALGQSWTGRSGTHVVMRTPRVALMRSFVINHLIHHRGQLSVYLRLLDVPVPSIYGPTADESGR